MNIISVKAKQRLTKWHSVRSKAVARATYNQCARILKCILSQSGNAHAFIGDTRTHTHTHATQSAAVSAKIQFLTRMNNWRHLILIYRFQSELLTYAIKDAPETHQSTEYIGIKPAKFHLLYNFMVLIYGIYWRVAKETHILHWQWICKGINVLQTIARSYTSFTRFTVVVDVRLLCCSFLLQCGIAFSRFRKNNIKNRIGTTKSLLISLV